MIARMVGLIVAGLLLTVVAGCTESHAAGGWYLLGRPLFDARTPIPMAQMNQLGAYESVTACEAAREKEVKQAWKEWRQAVQLKLQVPAWDIGIEQAATDWAGTLRCVASDDPRLGGRR